MPVSGPSNYRMKRVSCPGLVCERVWPRSVYRCAASSPDTVSDRISNPSRISLSACAVSGETSTATGIIVGGQSAATQCSTRCGRNERHRARAPWGGGTCRPARGRLRISSCRTRMAGADVVTA